MRLAAASMTLGYAREMKMGFPVDQDGGSAQLKKPITADGEFGALVKASESSNEDTVQSFANLGLAIGPVRSKAAYVLKADPAHYAVRATEVLRQAENLLALSLRTGG